MNIISLAIQHTAGLCCNNNGCMYFPEFKINSLITKSVYVMYIKSNEGVSMLCGYIFLYTPFSLCVMFGLFYEIVTNLTICYREGRRRFSFHFVKICSTWVYLKEMRWYVYTLLIRKAFHKNPWTKNKIFPALCGAITKFKLCRQFYEKSFFFIQKSPRVEFQ